MLLAVARAASAATSQTAAIIFLFVSYRGNKRDKRELWKTREKKLEKRNGELLRKERKTKGEEDERGGEETRKRTKCRRRKKRQEEKSRKEKRDWQRWREKAE